MDVESYLLGKKAGGGTPVSLQDKEVTITTNGETEITADSGYDGLRKVDLTTNVPQPSGKITITQNGTDIDVSSYASADVNVPAGITPTGTINITTNGTHDVTTYASASVNVPSQKYAPTYLSAGIFSNYSGNNLNYEVNNLDTSNITGMYIWFGGCSNLKSLDLSSWNTSNVSDMQLMFQNCSKLTSLNLSSFVIKNGINMSQMFSGCSKLVHLDIRNMAFSTLTSINTSGMFGANSYYYVPDNCEIIVKDDAEKAYMNTNFSRLTNVKTALEYEAE